MWQQICLCLITCVIFTVSGQDNNLFQSSLDKKESQIQRLEKDIALLKEFLKKLGQDSSYSQESKNFAILLLNKDLQELSSLEKKLREEILQITKQVNQSQWDDLLQQQIGKIGKKTSITLYISRPKELPKKIKYIERDVLLVLDKLKQANPNITYERKYLNASDLLTTFQKNNNTIPTDDASLEGQLYLKGLQPFHFNFTQDHQTLSSLIYASLVIRTENNKEKAISFLVNDGTITPSLTQDLVRDIRFLNLENKPKIAVWAWTFSLHAKRTYQTIPNDVFFSYDKFQNIYNLLNFLNYEVIFTDLLLKDRKDYDILLVINPVELMQEQRYVLAEALHQGKTVFLATQHYYLDYSIADDELAMNKNSIQTNVNEWISQYGATFSRDFLLDKQTTNIQFLNSGDRTFSTPLMFSVSSNDMKSPLLSSVPKDIYLNFSAAAHLQFNDSLLEEIGLTKTDLLHTSPKSWIMPMPQENRVQTEKLIAPEEAQLQAYPIFSVLKGNFPKLYQENNSQATSNNENPKSNSSTNTKTANQKPGKLYLLGCSQIFRDEITQNDNTSLHFLKSCLDYIVLHELKPINKRK